MIMYIDHTEREMTSKHDFFSFPSSNVAKCVCFERVKQLVMQSKVECFNIVF